MELQQMQTLREYIKYHISPVLLKRPTKLTDKTPAHLSYRAILEVLQLHPWYFRIEKRQEVCCLRRYHCEFKNCPSVLCLDKFLCCKETQQFVLFAAFLIQTNDLKFLTTPMKFKKYSDYRSMCKEDKLIAKDLNERMLLQLDYNLDIEDTKICKLSEFLFEFAYLRQTLIKQYADANISNK